MRYGFGMFVIVALIIIQVRLIEIKKDTEKCATPIPEAGR